MERARLFDIASERAVLAGIFQYGNNAFLDISDIVNVDCFSTENSVLFSCMKKALESSDELDDATLLSAAYDMHLEEHFNQPQERLYIQSLKEFPIRLANVRRHGIKLRKLHIARLLEQDLRKAQEDIKNVTGDETIDEIVALAEGRLNSFVADLECDGGPELLGVDAEDHIDYLLDNPGQIPGISTGCARIDKGMGGGFRRKTITLFCARMGVGKSMLADHFALHASLNLNIPVLMLDTEMSKEDHVNRLLANMSKLQTNDIEMGMFDKRALQSSLIKLKSLPYHYISVAGKEFSEVLSICRRWVMKEVGYDENGNLNDCLIVFDYFKLMDDKALKVMSEHQVLGFQIAEMHNFCVKYDCPVVSFVQTNRDGIDTEDTSVIAQSDRLAWIATVIGLFKAKTHEEMMEQPGLGNRKLIFLKTRHSGGLDSGDYINMNLDGGTATLTELPTRFEVEREHVDQEGFEDEPETD